MISSRVPLAPLTDDQRRRLGEVYESNYASVFRLSARILRDSEEAADATQEVFVVASRELADGALPANARMWLLTVARNHCLDLLRRRKRLGKILTTMGNSLEDMVNPEATVIGRQSVDWVLRGLSPRERQALWQSAVERRPLADIATGLRLNYMAAAQVLSRARRHAALAMTRVAAILLGLRVLRFLSRAGSVTRSALATHPIQLVALATVPLVLVSMQSSSGPVDKRPPTTNASSVVAARTGPTVANTNHAGTLTNGSGSQQLTTSSGASIGTVAGVSRIGNSALNQLTGALPSVARGLPPVPVPSVNPTLPPTPKVP
jgi:RNA polymerase sigma-70 factor, ECF subfamily